MTMNIKVKTFGMAREPEQLAEISEIINGSGRGDILLLPEYAAYTLEGSQKALNVFCEMASQRGVSIITTLNLPGVDLPHADPSKNYNTLFVFSRFGGVYTPQAKITPQSFEMRQLDTSFPRMNVAPYSFLNRVTLKMDGEMVNGFFFICSDLYVLALFGYEELKSEIIWCPANFGNGAEQAAGKVIEYSVQSGLFRQGFYCNTYQKSKNNVTPLTVGLEKSYESVSSKTNYDIKEMKKRVEQSSMVYPDDQYCNFKSMLKLTRQGTFTVPRSRSSGNGLDVQLGRYETVINL